MKLWNKFKWLSTSLILFPSIIFAQSWQVYFSPRGGCTNAIVDCINASRQTILIQAYSFTSVPIARALLNAHKRGIKIEIILDKSQLTDRYSSYKFFNNNKMLVKIDTQHHIAHNKIIIIDKKIVITGSFNFTKAAEENNAENLLIIKDAKIAEIYTKNWEEHNKHSN